MEYTWKHIIKLIPLLSYGYSRPVFVVDTCFRTEIEKLNPVKTLQGKGTTTMPLNGPPVNVNIHDN